VEVGDLVRVSYNTRPKPGEGFISLVLEVNKSENHPNGLGLVKVVADGQEMWYPLGYIEVINETR